MAEGKGLSAAALVLAAGMSGGGGGSEPSEYLKSATVSNGSLILTKKDNTTVSYDGKDLFWATPNTTTCAQLQEAVSNGKLPVFKEVGEEEDNIYVLQCQIDGLSYNFINVAIYGLNVWQAELVDGNTTWTYSSVPFNAYNIFWCTPGETTCEEINSAIANGKFPAVKTTDASIIYVLSGTSIPGMLYEFTNISGTISRKLIASALGPEGTPTTWTNQNTNLQPQLTAGSNISISNNTISATDTTYTDATTTQSGLMSANDKTKLNGLVNVSGEASGGKWQTITINGQENSIPWPYNEIYRCTYGATTWDELVEVWDDGALYPVLVKDNVIYHMVAKTSTMFMFSRIDLTPNVKGYSLNSNNIWQEADIDLQRKLTAGSKISINGSTSTISTTANEVSVSATGTATDEIGYITIDGVEKKIAGGGGSSYTFTNGLTESSGTVSWDLNDRISEGTNDALKINVFKSWLPRATGTNSINIGGNINKLGCTASNSFAIGLDNENTGLNSYTIGRSNSNNGRGGYIIGYDNEINITNASDDSGAVIIGRANILNLTNPATTILAGNNLKSRSYNQFVCGIFNVEDTSNAYNFIVGNGSSNSNRSNAYALDWSGNGRYKGDLYIGCAADSTGGTKVIPQTLNSTETTPTIEGSICWTYA